MLKHGIPSLPTGGGRIAANSSNTSDRHFGKLRRALNPASTSDNFAAPGSASRRFISHGTFAA